MEVFSHSVSSCLFLNILRIRERFDNGYFAHKVKVYGNRKIQGVALPEKEQTRQVGQSPNNGTHYHLSFVVVQFSCKLSCTPDLWNPRESRLKDKSHEAVETNAKLDKLMLSIHTAFDTLVGRNVEFDAEAVKNLFQGSLETQIILLGMADIVCEDLRKRIGVDRAEGTYPAYIYTRRTLAEFIEKEFHSKDVAFGQMTEQFIHDYQSFILEEKGLAIDTCRHYLAIVKKKSVTWQSPNIVPPISWQETSSSLPVIRELPMLMRYRLHGTISSRMMKEVYGSNTVAKNELQACVKLLPEALELIERYNDDNRPTLFPMLHYSNMRRLMKCLAVLADIREDLIYHAGRHSFASLITLEAGVPIETICKMLGHSNLQTIQVYAKVTPRSLSRI